MMNRMLEVITAMVEAAGKTSAFTTEEAFYFPFVQHPYDALEIRSWQAEHSYFGETRHISITHLASFPDRQLCDGEPELCMTEHGIPIELNCSHRVIPVVLVAHSGNTLVLSGARRVVEQTMAEWVPNIEAQGWLEVARTFNTTPFCTDDKTTETEVQHE